MSLARAVRALGPIDLRNVRRDPLLGWVVTYPFVLALVLRWGVPPLADWLMRRWQFELVPYYPLLASFVIGMAPGMVGVVVGFLLLDERDDHTLTALLVTPLPLASYVAYRVGVPLLVGFAVTLVVYPLTSLAPIPAGSLIGAAGLAALSAPITALFLATFAENKVSGFAWVKILNSLNLMPVVVWFVSMPLQLAAGLVPGYWPMKMVWVASAGESTLAYGLAGTAVNLFFIVALLLAFRRGAFRG